MKEKKYKLIATDFDDTLLRDDKTVSDYTKNTLLKYKNANFLIVGVTARSLLRCKKVCDINMFNYLILNNGASIYDVLSDQIDVIDYINYDTLLSIYSKFNSISKNILYCTNDIYYVKERLYDDETSIVIGDDISSIKDKIVAKITIILTDDNLLEYYMKHINNNYKDIRAFIMQDSKADHKGIMIMPLNINKGYTLKLLGDKTKINLSEMIFFGDSINDIEAIKCVGCSVAMENSFENIKKASKYVTKSNSSDGVAYFLEKNIKI